MSFDLASPGSPTPPLPALASLLTGENAVFIDHQYARWVADPASVEPAWAAIFSAELDDSRRPAERRGAGSMASVGPEADIQAVGLAAAQRQARIAQLINAHRVRGHTEASIDPLGHLEKVYHPELTLEYYGLGEADLDVPVYGRNLKGLSEVTSLRKIRDRLRKAYCGGFGVEFMNIDQPERKRWIQERVETLQDSDVLNREEELHVLRQLADAEGFERLLHNRFPGTKRFSVEGAETLIPLLDILLDHTSQLGAEHFVIGMAHRGRLNVLANVLRKPIRSIVDEFEDVSADSFQGSGDVKYHLGYDSEYITVKGQRVGVSLAYNPSHLEAVDPVVEGRVRAMQDKLGPEGKHKIVPLIIHGDAAFAGQGMVAETLNLSGLEGYGTGGSIHLIINNQIGFTTSPRDARSTPYCTDVARMLGVPIFHVNGEDVEAVAAVVHLAAEWRQTFHRDVVIDLYCFRRHGHNEGDEPSFTQPLLYDAIRAHPSPRVAYARRMVAERRSLTEEEVNRIVAESQSRLEEALTAPREEPGARGNGWRFEGSVWDEVDTRVPLERLQALLTQMNDLPTGFSAHRKIQRLLEQRVAIARGERPVDWAVAELGAYATLVDQGRAVRLSGQDSGRGTFSHRHAVLTDVISGLDHVPLAHLREGQGTFEVYDSLLSEAAVLGFEYGYTLESPDTLVLWEAQFGDFANGAQVIIDNFLMSSEQKWNLCSGLVMLLPHGYEGQGPEHSSARLERYLQLCAEENVVVANITTPANFFHLLRRQSLQRVRKPLVVMSPKSLLRHAECVSTLEELSEGHYQRVISETDADVRIESVHRVVFCSGKVYYELREARRARGVSDVALIRLEQLYPLPADEICAVLAAAPADVEVAWCQEEPRNMGAWPLMDEWMSEVLGGRPPRYIGRRRAAAAATGSPKRHRTEQAALIDEALAPRP